MSTEEETKEEEEDAGNLMKSLTDFLDQVRVFFVHLLLEEQ